MIKMEKHDADSINKILGQVTEVSEKAITASARMEHLAQRKIDVQGEIDKYGAQPHLIQSWTNIINELFEVHQIMGQLLVEYGGGIGELSDYLMTRIISVDYDPDEPEPEPRTRRLVWLKRGILNWLYG